MVDPSMQSCSISADYKESHERSGQDLYEELPLFMLEEIYKTPEQQQWLKEVIVARLSPRSKLIAQVTCCLSCYNLETT